MTAGSGILHQEMPKGDAQGRMHGFQLWANLPASLKMTDPRYQDIPSSAIPEVTEDDGTRVRIICGEFWGQRGPVEGVAADPQLHRHLGCAGQAEAAQGGNDAQCVCLCLCGLGYVPRCVGPSGSADRVGTRIPMWRRCTTWRTTRWCCSIAETKLWCRLGRRAFGSCWCQASRIEEPVAWYGPIVMNTQEEIRQAMAELHTGGFIKHR